MRRLLAGLTVLASVVVGVSLGADLAQASSCIAQVTEFARSADASANATMESCYSGLGFSLTRVGCQSDLDRLVAMYSDLLPGDKAEQTATYDTCRTTRSVGPDPAPPCVMKSFSTAGGRITGVVKNGYTLSAVPANWRPTPTSYEYQWYVNNKQVSGAVWETFTVRDSDLGKRVSLRIYGIKDCVRKKFVTVSAGTVKLAGTKKMPSFSGGTIKAKHLSGAYIEGSEPSVSYPYSEVDEWFINGKRVPSLDTYRGIDLERDLPVSFGSWAAGGTWQVQRALLVSRPGYRTTRFFGNTLHISHMPASLYQHFMLTGSGSCDGTDWNITLEDSRGTRQASYKFDEEDPLGCTQLFRFDFLESHQTVHVHVTVTTNSNRGSYAYDENYLDVAYSVTASQLMSDGRYRRTYTATLQVP